MDSPWNPVPKSYRIKVMLAWARLGDVQGPRSLPLLPSRLIRRATALHIRGVAAGGCADHGGPLGVARVAPESVLNVIELRLVRRVDGIEDRLARANGRALCGVRVEVENEVIWVVDRGRGILLAGVLAVGARVGLVVEVADARHVALLVYRV